MRETKRKEIENKLLLIFENLGIDPIERPSITPLKEEVGFPMNNAEVVRVSVRLDGWEYIGESTPEYFDAHWKELIMKPYLDYCRYLAEKIIEE